MTLTKEQELAVLDDAVNKLGTTSYLGPWLASVRHEAASAMSSDFYPDIQISCAEQSVKNIKATAESEAQTIRDAAKQEAAKMVDAARSEVTRLRSSAYHDLTQAAKSLTQ